MISLLKILDDCFSLNTSTRKSVIKDIFNYRLGAPVEFGLAPSNLSTYKFSIMQQLNLIKGKYIDIDVILVGGDKFLNRDLRDIDSALFLTRRTFAQVGLGIRKITFHILEANKAKKYLTINSRNEAKQLTKKYNGSNSKALDVFIVPNYSIGGFYAGIAARNVTCDKSLYIFSGTVLGLESGGVKLDRVRLGNLISHEVGHLLGLKHVKTIGNLMKQGGTGTGLSSSQGAKMKEHCSVRGGCW